ncbi:hypothetical protein C8Q80DRAFT_159292 [Daedaleopsis nitida]|nr:hypothetical protein C8Q80DRAFT_159292 [Daedaleopsis nitida]
MFPLNDFNIVACALATVSAAVGYNVSRRRSRSQSNGRIEPKQHRLGFLKFHRRHSTASARSSSTGLTDTLSERAGTEPPPSICGTSRRGTESDESVSISRLYLPAYTLSASSVQSFLNPTTRSVNVQHQFTSTMVPARNLQVIYVNLDSLCSLPPTSPSPNSRTARTSGSGHPALRSHSRTRLPPSGAGRRPRTDRSQSQSQRRMESARLSSKQLRLQCR